MSSPWKHHDYDEKGQLIHDRNTYSIFDKNKRKYRDILINFIQVTEVSKQNVDSKSIYLNCREKNKYFILLADDKLEAAVKVSSPVKCIISCQYRLTRENTFTKFAVARVWDYSRVVPHRDEYKDES